jgi:hypothetical protein
VTASGFEPAMKPRSPTYRRMTTPTDAVI